MWVPRDIRPALLPLGPLRRLHTATAASLVPDPPQKTAWARSLSVLPSMGPSASITHRIGLPPSGVGGGPLQLGGKVPKTTNNPSCNSASLWPSSCLNVGLRTPMVLWEAQRRPVTRGLVAGENRNYFSLPGPLKLQDVVKLPLLRLNTRERITDIWLSQLLSTHLRHGVVISGSQYDALEAK